MKYSIQLKFHKTTFHETTFMNSTLILNQLFYSFHFPLTVIDIF